MVCCVSYASALQPVCTVHLGCSTTKGLTRAHHQLVTLNRYLLQNLPAIKNEQLTNQ